MNLLPAIRKLFTVGRRAPVQNIFEAGRRFQFGDRSWIWSHVTDARFDATQATRYELTRKIRYFEQNSPLVQKLADLFELFTVGPNGLIMTPGSEDEEWAAAAKTFYADWSQAPDLCSLLPISVLQSLSARLWFIDGEVFILKTRTDKPPYRPRIRLIESHRVGTPTGDQAAGRTIVDGVEVDRNGCPIAYWVQDGFEAGDYARIPAENIIHIHEPSRAGMYRGITPFYATLNALHDLDDLMRMEMQVAKDQADTSKVIKTPTGEVTDPNDPNGWNVQTEADTTGQGNPLTEYYRRVFGPTTKVMKVGDEIDKSGPERPTVVQQWYWRFLCEEICNGVGIPLTMVFPDSMQGTVYRGVLDSANAFFRSRSAVLAGAWKQVWEYALDTGSRLEVSIADKPVDWRMVTVRPPRAVNVDVGRNSSAMLAELEAGTRTFAQVYAETGEDWRDQLEQKAKEAAFINQLARKYKVPPLSITQLAVAATPKPAAPAQQPQPQSVTMTTE